MKDTVLVFGSGRSGTSWLCETMSRPKGYRLLFEPEHDEHVPQGSVLTDKLLIPGQSYPEADRFLNKLFSNRIDNDWIAQHSYRKYKMHLWPFIVKRKIVKFVRCSLGMHYMANKFDVHSVYIFRNPYSTIFSQNRVKFPWLTDLKKFQSQSELCLILSELYNLNISHDQFTTLEKLAIRWCIENLFPFRYFQSTELNSKIEFLEYEELIKNIEGYESLLKRINLDSPNNLVELFRNPSSKTHPKSNIITGKPANYENLFDQHELDQISGILKVFQYKRSLSSEVITKA